MTLRQIKLSDQGHAMFSTSLCNGPVMEDTVKIFKNKNEPDQSNFYSSNQWVSFFFPCIYTAARFEVD